MSAYRSVLKNLLDTADIVRDGDFSPRTKGRMSVSMAAKGFYRAIVVFGTIATSLGQLASPAERDV